MYKTVYISYDDYNFPVETDIIFMIKIIVNVLNIENDYKLLLNCDKNFFFQCIFYKLLLLIQSLIY